MAFTTYVPAFTVQETRAESPTFTPASCPGWPPMPAVVRAGTRVSVHTFPLGMASCRLGGLDWRSTARIDPSIVMIPSELEGEEGVGAAAWGLLGCAVAALARGWLGAVAWGFGGFTAGALCFGGCAVDVLRFDALARTGLGLVDWRVCWSAVGVGGGVPGVGAAVGGLLNPVDFTGVILSPVAVLRLVDG